MPFGSVTLQPGVNVERTPTALTASYSASQLIRFRDGLGQKYGGWARFYPNSLPGKPRELHAWEDLGNNIHLLVGTTTALDVITSGALQEITPQSFTSDFAPNFSTVINTPTVTITDPNISNITVYDSVLFNTPVSVGGIILTGLYPIFETLGGSSYKIIAATNATGTVNNGGAVPEFTTTSGSSFVTVTFNDHGLTSSGIGIQAVFLVSTTGNGVTIVNDYTVTSIVDPNNFQINVAQAAGAGAPFFMNAGNAELVYFLTAGPPPAGGGYGTGTYGGGAYGTGTGTGGGGPQTGIPITATDWTSDNWGEIALACPQGGGVYQFDPTSGFLQASIISSAPPYNGGIFVSTSLQILVCWASTVMKSVGVQQDPLLVAWSALGDFTNFAASVQNQAGNFRIPNGTTIRGGLATPNQNLIWTDLDCWAMNYQGPPFVFGFNKIGVGAGLISSHAILQLRGNVFWMGPSNFYALSSGGVMVLPCPVWDFVFQNLNPAFTANVRGMPNTPFNEAGWLFPSNASENGECDCYVKFNITEQNAPWDFGPSQSLQRSAWIDQTILGPPIGANSGGIIYQHETTNDADGTAMMSSFTTGYYFIDEGEQFCIVDQVMPDFRWGFFGSPQNAQIQLTFNVVNFPGDTPTTYGPYTVTQATQYLIVRFRGRQVSVTVASSDIGSFWRLGHIRYRYAVSGRR